jgi:hypothetical protein
MISDGDRGRGEVERLTLESVVDVEQLRSVTQTVVPLWP